MKFQIGVFQISNTVNSKIYIGGSTDLVVIPAIAGVITRKKA